MAERCGFFNATNSSNPDRVYDSSDFAAYFASFIGNGVFAKHSDQLRVAQQDSPDMSVQVLGGQAWINGWWYENTSTLNLDIDPADGTLDRIDIIVVQFDLTNRVIKTIVRKGSPSAGATAPELNRDDDLWELKLAEVDVSHGTVNITDGKITDTRSNTEVCGWVSGLINQMDTTELFNQLKEATQDAVDAMNEALDGTTEGELKAYKKSLRLENNINTGADLDTFTTPGNYSCSAENSASVINKPEGVTGAFMLFVYEQQEGVTLQELFSLETPDVYMRIVGSLWLRQFAFDTIDNGKNELLRTKVIFEGTFSVGSSIGLDAETNELLENSSYVIAEFTGANISLLGRFDKSIGDKNNHSGMLHLFDSFSWGNVLANKLTVYSMTLHRTKAKDKLTFNANWLLESSGSTGAVSARPLTTGSIAKLTIVL